MNIYNKSIPNQDMLIRAHINENHFGYSPQVCESLKNLHMNLYPDPESVEIRAKLADFYNLNPDMLTVSNGTDEVILMIALAFCDYDTKVIVAGSSFPGYQTAARACGAEIELCDLKDYKNPVEQIGFLCRKKKSLIFLCNPHNPTGTLMSHDAVLWLLEQAEYTNSLVVIDEAYAEFAGKEFDSSISFILKNKRVIVTRTFSKAYGLAGFRIGYALGLAPDIARVKEAQCTVPFCVNRLAQIAAQAALRDQEFLNLVVEQTNDAKSNFYKYLEHNNISYVKSYSNSVLIKINNSADLASYFYENLGVLVRDTKPFGLDNHVRVTMCLSHEMEKIYFGLESWLKINR